MFPKISICPAKKVYFTEGGIEVTCNLESVDPLVAVDEILKNIDNSRGVLFSSSYEYPGRYTRWDIGFINPSLEIRSQGRDFSILALNERGKLLLQVFYDCLQSNNCIERLEATKMSITGIIKQNNEFFYEEDRTKQPNIFSVLRTIRKLFASKEDSFLGLYGAFGYDLIFQFDPIELKHPRSIREPDLVFYLPDDIAVVDHQTALAYRIRYDFKTIQGSTEGLPRSGESLKKKDFEKILLEHRKGVYADMVREAIKEFKKGNLFEVVPSQSLYVPCPDTPSVVFRRLKSINPSPYGFIINLGNECLVGSSPEMYVRVEGDRVETCPISGTIRRGKNAIEDAEQIKILINSNKDESELTMCTDVDRNDKSRVCRPGTVRVIGRRQIEIYSHLIHTVDHVEGRLSPEYDSIDAFITHMWAVTITGAPKRAAIRWVEEHESSARGWYGGAVGYFAFNGDLNTGLTLRTIRIKNDQAEIRVGATLLYDSIPEEEEEETYIKAAALIQALEDVPSPQKGPSDETVKAGKGKKILLVDHEDSFVHTIASYFKQTGAEVMTLRSPLARKIIEKGEKFDLVVLSPGPGTPSEFKLNETIDLCIRAGLPLFGICLGLQGLIEYFGGRLGQLDCPMHGKASSVKVSRSGKIFTGLPKEFNVGRYHSLYAVSTPDILEVTARSSDGVVMAIEHRELPIAAVQFHPESIMTSHDNIGLKLIINVVSNYTKKTK